jgi:Zn-dependent M28 family amino/carboxypeptidase
MVRGRGRPDLALIITAHYDHLGVQNGQIFNGADDNASGAAALFALAASFVAQPPRHTLVFAALDAEETGLFGARALLERPALGRYRIVINVNLDMVGRDPNNTLFVAGLAHYPFLKPYVDRIAADAPIKLVPGHDGRGSAATEDWTRESDHYVFHQRGIPFLYFGVEDDANHHRPTDKVAAISRRFYVGAVETVAAALRVLDANAAAIAAQPRKVGALGRGSNQVPGSARSRTPDPDRGTLILGLRTLGPWTPLDLLEDS